MGAAGRAHEAEGPASGSSGSSRLKKPPVAPESASSSEPFLVPPRFWATERGIRPALGFLAGDAFSVDAEVDAEVDTEVDVEDGASAATYVEFLGSGRTENSCELPLPTAITGFFGRPSSCSSSSNCSKRKEGLASHDSLPIKD